MEINNVSTIINTLLLAVVTFGVGYVGTQAKKFIPIGVKLLISKIGLTNYTKTKALALDIWNKIEEDTRLGEFTGNKIEQFTTLLKEKVPEISDTEIDLLNKAIAGEVNKDKEAVVKAINEPVIKTVVVAPITKYVTPDGKELNVVETKTEEQKPVDTTSAETVVAPQEASAQPVVAPVENTATVEQPK